MVPLPDTPGTYVLLLNLPQPLTVRVGRLGNFTLDSGVYAYVGSAFGPGGLKARVYRHLRPEKPLHWHIDYLLPHTRVLAVYYVTTTEHLECAWNQSLCTLTGAKVPISGFGASDCHSGCPAHLVRLLPPTISQVKSTLHNATLTAKQMFESRQIHHTRGTPSRIVVMGLFSQIEPG